MINIEGFVWPTTMIDGMIIIDEETGCVFSTQTLPMGSIIVHQPKKNNVTNKS